MPCHTCTFWDAPAGYDRMKVKDTDQAKCLYNPPTSQLIPAQGMGGPTLQAVSHWPIVPAFNFCHCEETDPACEGFDPAAPLPDNPLVIKPN